MIKEENKPKLKGIGGWLLFYTILLIFRLILAVIGIVIGEIKFAIVIHIILVGVLLFTIFTKSRYMKTINIVCLIVYAIWVIIDYYILISGGNFEELSKATWGVVRSTAISTAWILYLIKSKRVKNTFIK